MTQYIDGVTQGGGGGISSGDRTPRTLSYPSVAAADPEALLSGFALADGEPTVLDPEDMDDQPDVPRRLVVSGTVEGAENSAFLITDDVTPNTGIGLEATDAGSAGNDITFQMIVPGGVTNSLSVALVGGNRIQVTLAKIASLVTSTATDVVGALQGDGGISAIAGCAALGDGTGIVAAYPETHLTGGIDVRPASTGTVTLTGTDAADGTITEDVELDGDTSVPVLKAFKTVGGTFPQRTGVGDLVSIGTLDWIGLPHALAVDTVRVAYVDGVRIQAGVLARAAVTVDPDTVALNAVDLLQIADEYDGLSVRIDYETDND